MFGSVDRSWQLLADEATKSEPSSCSFSDILTATDVLRTSQLDEIFLEWYHEKYRLFLSKEAIPTFWETFKTSTGKPSRDTFLLANSVEQLLEEGRKWTKNHVMSVFLGQLKDQQFEEKITNQLKNSFLSDVPVGFQRTVYEVFCHCFKISRHLTIRQSQKENEENDDLVEDEDNTGSDPSACPVCHKSVLRASSSEDMMEDDLDQSISGSERSTCNCSEILEAFDRLNQNLDELNLLHPVTGDAVTSVVLNYMEKYVRLKTHGSFSTRSIDGQLRWIRKVVAEWLKFVYKKSEESFCSSVENLVIHKAYSLFADVRIEQLFDIIIEYPESSPAIEDLRGCLDQCFGLRREVVESLRKSFEERLFHPGVATNDILTAYIQTIKALRLLDPTGVILQLVSDPLKTYLKQKDDTVRCIIANLVDENCDLIPELVRAGAKAAEDGDSPSDDENVIRNWQSWNPDPIDAARAPKHTRAVRSQDIVSILVDVYESKDLFVEEYQRLLSHRFLTSYECNEEFERRNLELLTLKFGESDLHACEVMLADMTSSRRIDSRINSGEISAHHFTDFPINCIIMSAQFWPEKIDLTHMEEGKDIILPKKIEEAIETYTKAFETIKPSRTLQWKKHLGVVEIELDFDDSSNWQSFTVTPLQAAIIAHFQEQSVWRLSLLSTSLGVTPSLLRRQLVFWQNKGIIRESGPDEYSLLSRSNSLSDDATRGVTPVLNEDDEEDMDDSMADGDDFGGIQNKKSGRSNNERDDKYRIYWSYIENMLTNLSNMTLEKVHSTLQMFALQGTSSEELTVQELRHFLDGKVREGKLTYSAGCYKLTQ